MQKVSLQPQEIALFLDIDGTLLEIEDHPDNAIADRPLLELLETLYACTDGATALISGRTIADIDRIFAPLKLPAAGAHGAELRIRVAGPVRDSTVWFPQEAQRRLKLLIDGHKGLLLERKSSGVALHYRGAPHLEKECYQIITAVTAQLGEAFHMLEGKMVFEIVPQSCNKGKAIAEFLVEPPFFGRLPVFIGDDKTDEDGFRTVINLCGLAIRVGAGRTLASKTLPNVGAVRNWLQEKTLSLGSD